MSYSEAMAKHCQDKRKDGNIKHQLKYANTYPCKNEASIDGIRIQTYFYI